jgi:predicted dehydrogenase
MYRIGIIGTENSHALAFAKRFNLPDETTGKPAYPDARVVMVYGPDTETSRRVMNEADVPACADTPADFFGKVDAMMITSRWGSVHSGYALPFAEVGIPLFVDKPFTSDIAQAQQLVETAVLRGTPIMGGSGCKYAQDVLDIGQKAQEWRKEGVLLSGSGKFTADPTSEYDGFFFYASHLIEMALAIFGSDMETVQALERKGNVLALAGYPDFTASLHFTPKNYDCGCTLYGKKESLHRIIDVGGIHEREADIFVEMLRTGAMPQPPEDLIRPVRIIESILESMKTGSPVRL